MLLKKDRFISFKFLVSKALIDSNIRHEEFVSINNILRVFNETKEKLKFLKLLGIMLHKYG